MKTDDFNARYYLEANPDVAASGMDPSVHYRRYGRFEGRRGWLDDDGLANRTLSQEFPNVDTRIHPKDEMFKLVAQNPNIRHPAALYLSTGLWVKECVLRALAEAEIDCQRLEHVLDFASGYGRVTRFWLQEFKAEQLWVSDVQHGAVDYLVETLGVHGIYASHDPASTQFPRLFDLVISISLFTHLPEQRTQQWLAHLISTVKPGGMLLFSFHGLEQFEAACPIRPESGFVHGPDSESDVLTSDEYGTTYFSQDYLCRILKATGGVQLETVIPRGLCEFQDLALVRRLD